MRRGGRDERLLKQKQPRVESMRECRKERMGKEAKNQTPNAKLDWVVLVNDGRKLWWMRKKVGREARDGGTWF